MHMHLQARDHTEKNINKLNHLTHKGVECKITVVRHMQFAVQTLEDAHE